MPLVLAGFADTTLSEVEPTFEDAAGGLRRRSMALTSS
jgi:hypothetical protein